MTTPSFPMPPMSALGSSGFKLSKGKVLKLANSVLAISVTQVLPLSVNLTCLRPDVTQAKQQATFEVSVGFSSVI